jgi:hypothetical protein
VVDSAWEEEVHVDQAGQWVEVAGIGQDLEGSLDLVAQNSLEVEVDSDQS